MHVWGIFSPNNILIKMIEFYPDENLYNTYYYYNLGGNTLKLI